MIRVELPDDTEFYVEGDVRAFELIKINIALGEGSKIAEKSICEGELACFAIEDGVGSVAHFVLLED